MSRMARVAAVAVIAIALQASLSVLTAGWWATFGLGLLVGVFSARALMAIPIGAAVGLVGFGLPLVIAQFRYGLGPSAAAISAILGLGHQGAFAIALTLLIGLLLGVTGAWLGSAAQAVFVAARARVDGPRNE